MPGDHPRLDNVRIEDRCDLPGLRPDRKRVIYELLFEGIEGSAERQLRVQGNCHRELLLYGQARGGRARARHGWTTFSLRMDRRKSLNSAALAGISAGSREQASSQWSRSSSIVNASGSGDWYPRAADVKTSRMLPAVEAKNCPLTSHSSWHNQAAAGA